MPQWARTAVVTFLWLGTMMIWTSATSLTARYGTGIMAGVGLAMGSALVCHLWPTRTSAWRTVAWTWVITISMGAMLLISGFGQYAVTIATTTGFLFVLLRANQNGRKLLGAIKTYRLTR